MSVEKKELSMEVLEMVSGGKLNVGWENTMDEFLRKQEVIEPLLRMGSGRIIDPSACPPLLKLLEDIGDICGQPASDKVKDYVINKLFVVV